MVAVRMGTLESNPQTTFNGASTSHPMVRGKQLRVHIVTMVIQRKVGSGV